MSRKGITISPRMMNVGSTTPACHGSKKTSISCRPRKYQGALEGFGVRVGLAGSSSGASTRSDQTISSRMMPIEIRNSLRTRWGQVWILSSPGPVAFLIGTSIRFPPPAGATAFSGGLGSGVAMASALLVPILALGLPPREPEDQDEAEHEEEGHRQHAGAREDEGQHDQHDREDAPLELARHRRLERGPREAVATDAPEVDRHEE